MKKIVLAVVLFSFLTPFAGFGAEKLKLRSGSWLVGGSFSFVYTQVFTENSSPFFNAGLYIKSGYFMTRETLLELTLSYNTNLRFNNTGAAVFESNLGSATLQFVYLLSSEEPVNLFFGFGAGYGLEISAGPAVAWDNIIQNQRMLVDVAIGILIPLSPSVAFEAQLMPTLSIPLGSNGVMGIGTPILCGISAFLY